MNHPWQATPILNHSSAVLMLLVILWCYKEAGDREDYLQLILNRQGLFKQRFSPERLLRLSQP